MTTLCIIQKVDRTPQMLFTWDTTNLCIVFHWWHISSTFTLLLSLVFVALLTAGYELVRDMSRRYEATTVEYANSLPSKLRTIPPRTASFGAAFPVVTPAH